MEAFLYERERNHTRYKHSLSYEKPASRVPEWLHSDYTHFDQGDVVTDLRSFNLSASVQSFFDSLTPQQWQQMKQGSPDVATKALLADALFEIIRTVATSLRDGGVDYHTLSKEELEANLGNRLARSFAQVLGLDEEVQTPSSKRLTSLVAQEVIASIKGVSWEGDHSNPHITPPRTLNNMIRHAFSMLKSLLACGKDVSFASGSKWTSDAGSQSTASAPEQSFSHEDSFVLATNKAVQKIIRKEAIDMTEPVLRKVIDGEYEQLQAHVFKDVDGMADEISYLMTQEAVGLEKHVKTSTFRGKLKVSLKRGRQKMKKFFARHFTRVWIIRLAGLLKKRYTLPIKTDTPETMQSLIFNTDKLLTNDEGEKKSAVNQETASFRLGRLSPSNVQEFTSEVSELIYKYISGGSIPDITSETLRSSCQSASDLKALSSLLAALHTKVQFILAMVKWWWETQADNHSKMVSLALATIPVADGFSNFASSVVDVAKEQPVRKKIMVNIVVEKVVLRILKKAKVMWGKSNPYAIIKHLFDTVWDAVKDVHFDTSPEGIKDLDKTIFKELCHTWGSPEMVLASMRLNKPEIDKAIASTFTKFLTNPPKKCGGACRFFFILGMCNDSKPIETVLQKPPSPAP